jgi:hypothetical protein
MVTSVTADEVFAAEKVGATVHEIRVLALALTKIAGRKRLQTNTAEVLSNSNIVSLGVSKFVKYAVVDTFDAGFSGEEGRTLLDVFPPKTLDFRLETESLAMFVEYLKHNSCESVRGICFYRSFNQESKRLALADVRAFAGAVGRHGALPFLETLSFHSYGIRTAGASIIFDALGRPDVVPALKSLYITFNGIDDDGAIAIAKALGREGSLQSLQKLNLSGNMIKDAGMAALAEVMGRPGVLPSLKRLALGANEFGAEGTIAFANCLCREGAFASLEVLNLRCNFFDGEGANALAMALGRPGAVPSLQILDLSLSDIDAEHLVVFTEQLGREGAVPSLRTLDLHDCNFDASGPRAVALSKALKPKGVDVLCFERFVS